MINKIEEWGKWARLTGYERHSTPMYALMRANGCFHTGNNREPNITDEEALAIDKAVLVLKKNWLVLYEVLFLKYVKGASLRDIAKWYLTPLEYPKQVKMKDDDPRKKFVCHKIAGKMLEQAEKIVYKNLDFDPSTR